jgi:hypothetical protein
MYKCDYCNYISDRKYNVTLHSNIKHNNQAKLVNNCNECLKCTKIFSSKSNLIRHSHICNGYINPLQCQKCNKIFQCTSNKSRHTKTCKTELKKEKDVNPLIINNITNNDNCVTNINNITNNNNIINNTYIFQTDPNIHPLAYQNYNMHFLSNDVILPNKNNFPLMIEDFGRLIYNDERNKNIKKSSNKTKYCLVKKEDGEWVNKLDKDIIPKATKDIAYNFRIIVDDNETELFNINKKLKSIIPELTDFLGILVDYNFELEELNDTDKDDAKLFNDMKNRTICIILDSSKNST